MRESIRNSFDQQYHSRLENLDLDSSDDRIPQPPDKRGISKCQGWALYPFQSISPCLAPNFDKFKMTSIIDRNLRAVLESIEAVIKSIDRLKLDLSPSQVLLTYQNIADSAQFPEPAPAESAVGLGIGDAAILSAGKE